MKSLFALLLLSVLCQVLPAQATYIKFREDGWSESQECSKCVNCEGLITDVRETQKTFVFYAGEESLGMWKLLKIELPTCDSVYFRTNSLGREGMGLSTFASDEEAIADICREVRFYCPAALEIRRIESPHTEYSLLFIRDFFSHKLYTSQDKSTAQVAASSSGNDDEIFKVAAQMPRFPGCEDIEGASQKKQCADKKMLEFIYSNLRYPQKAKDQGIEGTTIVTFIVEVDGGISYAEVVRDIGGGCGEEALRLVNLMNEKGMIWIPGHNEHGPVRVQFNLPVKFSLAPRRQATGN